MNSLIVIKQLDETHAALLTQVSRQTFFDAFTASNTKENMNAYLDENLNENRIMQELCDKNSLFYGAYMDGAIAGYCKLGMNTPPEGVTRRPAIELERLYVLEAHQNKKVGAALMQHCVDYAVLHGYKAMWLGVWEHNTNAMRFYEKWGYGAFGSHVFMVGDDAQTDIWMKKYL